VLFAALHTVESGTWRPIGRFQNEADMHDRVASTPSLVDDPTETLAANFAVTHNAAFPTMVW
jgi:hypothetical protein